jgi:hypothetical protein
MTSIRPQTIAEIARRAKDGSRPFDVSVREFLDAWQTMPQLQRGEAVASEPLRLDMVKDAYLAALAEHLTLADGKDTPAWTEDVARFLSEPFFAGGLESLKATLLVESPLAFRRRLIFISADALSRPNRDFIQDNALNAALDV